MLIAKSPVKSFLVLILFSGGIFCEDQSKSTADARVASTEGDISNGIEYQGYGKRPSGHSFVRFGKRDGNTKSHSMMYFGKRGTSEEESNNLAELLQYLQRSQEPSWKRGHSILRFGKRAQDKHNFIRFGKREDDDEDIEKRAAHSMMYFGKRNGNKHSMIYFGKRQPSDGSMEDVDKRGGHSMMYFGKRPDEDMEKKAGHSMMYFGKRPDEDMGKKASHSMMYFGKRQYADDDMDKRASHSMMYFGKRDLPEDESYEPDEEKRANHQIIRFGKRNAGFNDYWLRNSVPFTSLANRYFAPLSSKMGTASRVQSVDKKKHNMMHFGKRSVDEDAFSAETQKPSVQSSTVAKSKEAEHVRPKREADSPEPVVPFVPFIPVYDPESSFESLDYSGMNVMEDPGQFLIPSKDVKSESKNEFLRFGKH